MPWAVTLRFVTGVALAGVYPVGMKLMTSWFDRGRGFALGVLIAALTLGSALPQLVSSFASLPWRGVLATASVLACRGGLRGCSCDRGRWPRPPAARARGSCCAFRDRGPLLANLGYFGHMWELYAMWTWVPAYVAASLTASSGVVPGRTVVGLTAFTVIGVAGVVGCLGAGRLVDRLGRARVAGWAMRVSATCCVLAALVFGLSPWVVAPVLLVWGVSVIADSGLFSSCVADVVDPRYVGTALTTQTAIGFLLTVVTINAVPWVVDRWAGGSRCCCWRSGRRPARWRWPGSTSCCGAPGRSGSLLPAGVRSPDECRCRTSHPAQGRRSAVATRVEQ